jgi:hypothetical protein
MSASSGTVLSVTGRAVALIRRTWDQFSRPDGSVIPAGENYTLAIVSDFNAEPLRVRVPANLLAVAQSLTFGVGVTLGLQHDIDRNGNPRLALAALDVAK